MERKWNIYNCTEIMNWEIEIFNRNYGEDKGDSRVKIEVGENVNANSIVKTQLARIRPRRRRRRRGAVGGGGGGGGGRWGRRRRTSLCCEEPTRADGHGSPSNSISNKEVNTNYLNHNKYNTQTLTRHIENLDTNKCNDQTITHRIESLHNNKCNAQTLN